MWGDETLHRGLSCWGRGMLLREAKLILQRLIQTSFLVPIDTSDEGPSLKMVEEEGGWVVPAYTHADLFSQSPYAALLTQIMDGRSLFSHMAYAEGVRLAVNPGFAALKLSSDDCSRLAVGEMPEPFPMSTSRLSTSAVMRALGIETATREISTHALEQVRRLLTGRPEASYASVFSLSSVGSVPTLNLGVKFRCAAGSSTDRMLEEIRGLVPEGVKVLLLEDPLEPQVRARVAPFFTR